jgi:hypothetical protein
MVELTDITLIQGHGNFGEVMNLMKTDGNDVWMLESRAFVTSSSISSSFLLHFWNNGKVVIRNTDHPISNEVPDDDIRELSFWCKMNGWHSLVAHKDLLSNNVDFDFWLRMFRAGAIQSDELQKHEEAEMARFQNITESKNAY